MENKKKETNELIERNKDLVARNLLLKEEVRSNSEAQCMVDRANAERLVREQALIISRLTNRNRYLESIIKSMNLIPA